MRDIDVNYYNGSIIDTTKGISVNTNPNNIPINITALFSSGLGSRIISTILFNKHLCNSCFSWGYVSGIIS